MSNLKLNPIPIPNAVDIPIEDWGDTTINDEIKHLIETFEDTDATEEDIEVEMAKTRFEKFKKRLMIESIKNMVGHELHNGKNMGILIARIR